MSKWRKEAMTTPPRLTHLYQGPEIKLNSHRDDLNRCQSIMRKVSHACDLTHSWVCRVRWDSGEFDLS